MKKKYSFLQTLGAALRASQAIENRRRPSPRDLQILGVDASRFG